MVYFWKPATHSVSVSKVLTGRRNLITLTTELSNPAIETITKNLHEFAQCLEVANNLLISRILV